MTKRLQIISLSSVVALAAIAYAGTFKDVNPGEFDPAKTRLANAAWLRGLGCPTGATTFDGSMLGTFTAGGCPTGDPKDKNNEGLLLTKTGPTANVVASLAELKDVKGITLSELGYDLRKPGANQNDPRGSHCGAGAPRFNVVTTDDVTHFVGCNSPAPVVAAVGDGWMRLRWTAAELAAAFPPISGTSVVKEITILFDEGQDTGPDEFGLAVLDNVDVNGVLVGRGPTNAG
jgi:hypothetical protein